MTFQEVLSKMGKNPNQIALDAKMNSRIIYDLYEDRCNPTIKTLLRLNKLGIICTVKNGVVIWGMLKEVN